MSAWDFLKESDPPSKKITKSNFFRVEPHPDYMTPNGVEHHRNGPASPNIDGSLNGTGTNGHISPPTRTSKSIKSPRTFSLTSRASTRTGASSTHPSHPPQQSNGYPYTPAPLPPSSKSISGLKTWLSRHKSKGVPGGPAAGSLGLRQESQQRQQAQQQHQHPAGGFSYYNDEEEDDPLVCAAPVVAFGRGW